MPLDEQVMRNLALSLVSCAALLVCARHAYPAPPSLVGAVRWASLTALLGVLVHLLWCVWVRYRRHMTRGREEYTGVELDGGMERGVEVRSPVVLYPELTIASVWVYVYGVGLLLFVSLYCLSGLEVISTCWWVVGMTPLAMDELISGGMERTWVAALMLLAYANATIVWFFADGSHQDLYSYEPWRLLAGVVAPVLCPFIFFSLRGTARSAAQDVSRLCGLALPFMVVLALCALAWTDQAGRRRLPARVEWVPPRSNWTETPARFYPTAAQGDPVDLEPYLEPYLGPICLVLSPLVAAAALCQLVASVLEGFTSEFIHSLLLLLATRHWLLHHGHDWTGAFVGVVTAGLAFVLLLCVRRV